MPSAIFDHDAAFVNQFALNFTTVFKGIEWSAPSSQQDRFKKFALDDMEKGYTAIAYEMVNKGGATAQPTKLLI